MDAERTFASWSVQQAIQDQVEMEDLYRWAQQPDEDLPEQRVTPQVRWTEVPAHVFGRQVIRFAHSMLP